MILSNIFRVALATLTVVSVSAHPDFSPEERVEYKQHVARSTEALSQCLDSRGLNHLHKRMAAQQRDTVLSMRQARSLQKPRAYVANKPAATSWNGITHEKNIGHSKDPQDLFGFRWDKQPSARPGVCHTMPENVYGPFWHEGQPERQDIRAGEKGIYMRLAMQVIDLSTCKPMQDARVYIWHTNAVGHYSDKAVDSLRGWQRTSNWGTVDFDTIFPGHYDGRATHVHIAIREHNEKRVVSTGQIFFDEWPRINIEQTPPYTGDTANVTTNIEDDYLSLSASDRFDPFAQWAWLGPNYPRDGLLAWITVGVNTSDQSIHQPPPQ